MIRRIHHLSDERLVEYCRAARAGEPVDPPAAEHLLDCAECGTQYAEISQFLAVLRQEAERDTDDVFSADWLRAQQQRIAQRLEHVGRPVRVIRFPVRGTTTTAAPSRSHTVTRWVAGAAAAGLFIGVGLGIFFDSSRLTRRGSSQSASSSTSPAATRPASSNDASDEAFLVELQLAVEGPQTRALAPFDALTPRVLEAANTVR